MSLLSDKVSLFKLLSSANFLRNIIGQLGKKKFSILINCPLLYSNGLVHLPSPHYGSSCIDFSSVMYEKVELRICK